MSAASLKAFPGPRFCQGQHASKHRAGGLVPCVLITQRVAQREGSESRTAAKGPAISGTT